jgi:hypothetical protein
MEDYTKLPSDPSSKPNIVNVLPSDSSSQPVTVNVENNIDANVTVPAKALHNAAHALGDGAIMAAGLSAAMKAVSHSPNLGVKVAAGAAGLVLGAAGIASKNAVQDATKKSDNYDGKSSFIRMPPQSSGNPTYDLLNIAVYLEYFKIILILILGLLFLIKIFNLDKLTGYLEKYLPIKIHRFIG